MKRCIYCNLIQPYQSYHRRSDSKDGYKNYCKVCALERQANRYHNNPVTNARYKAMSKKQKIDNPNLAKEEYLRNKEKYKKEHKNG